MENHDFIAIAGIVVMACVGLAGYLRAAYLRLIDDNRKGRAIIHDKLDRIETNTNITNGRLGRMEEWRMATERRLDEHDKRDTERFEYADERSRERYDHLARQLDKQAEQMNNDCKLIKQTLAEIQNGSTK